MLKTKERLTKMMSDFTGKPENIVANDIDRDFWMTSDDAKKYGVIDKVLK